jgi:hypothetical protein
LLCKTQRGKKIEKMGGCALSLLLWSGAERRGAERSCKGERRGKALRKQGNKKNVMQLFYLKKPFSLLTNGSKPMILALFIVFAI